MGDAGTPEGSFAAGTTLGAAGAVDVRVGTLVPEDLSANGAVSTLPCAVPGWIALWAGLGAPLPWAEDDHDVNTGVRSLDGGVVACSRLG